MRLFAALLAALPSAAAAQTPDSLQVVFFDVGMGDATLIVSPSGQTMLVDAGLENRGAEVILPYLIQNEIGRLDVICTTHYHTDHLGGIDELIKAGVQVGEVLDRGDLDTPDRQAFYDYQAAAAGLRRTALPGEVLDLGSGVRLTCLSVNGHMANGASIDLSGTPQQENSASISWKLEYADFDLFLGGDLTGGSNKSVDVEGPVGLLCGDVDVYQVNMHGAALASARGFLTRIRPEFAVVSVSSPNGSNFPRPQTIERLNRPERTIPVWATSAGNGGSGFVDAGGHITLHTDGQSYTVQAEDGTRFRAWCDEVETQPHPVGTLRISEFLRDPVAVQDDLGEWIELGATQPTAPLGLRGTVVRGRAGEEFTLAINLRLDSAETFVLGADGIPSRNGGYRPQIAWPTGALSLPDATGSLSLVDANGVTQDQLQYDPAWPGRAGTAAERSDLLAPTELGNFADAVTPFGAGDRGTPAARNAADTTPWFPGGPSWIEYRSFAVLGEDLEILVHLPGESGQTYRAALALGTEPGIVYRGTPLPINDDQLFAATTSSPGWSGVVPADEVASMSAPLPYNASLVGRPVYALVLTLDRWKRLRTWSRPIPMTISY